MSFKMYEHEIAFHNHDAGLEVAKALLNEGYVVMLSLEESLLIVNYEWSWSNSNRNDMVFIPRDIFDDKYCEIVKEDDEVDNED